MLPETPRYHIKSGHPEKAAKSLSRLRRLDADHPALVEELGEITANHEYELSLGKATYLDCFKGNLGKRLATGCLLQSLQQLTGVNFIFYCEHVDLLTRRRINETLTDPTTHCFEMELVTSPTLASRTRSSLA